jgi:hypothetical protein
MYKLDRVYNQRFFKQRRFLSWRIPIVVDAIMDVLKPKSVVDVGCGNGDLLFGFAQRGIDILGIEGTENAKLGTRIPDSLLIHDARTAFSPVRRYDLAMCMSVAEHLEDEFAGILVDNLCRLSDRVLFSAARPGVGGKGHVNCRSPEYWLYKFMAREYAYQYQAVDALREHWERYKHKKGIKGYYQDLQYFERRDVA